MGKAKLLIAQTLIIDFGEKKKTQKNLQAQDNSQYSKHLPACYVIPLVDARPKLKIFLISLPRLPTFHVGAALK